VLPVHEPKLVCAHAQKLDGRCTALEGIADHPVVVEAQRRPRLPVDDGHEDLARERGRGIERREIADGACVGVARRTDDDAVGHGGG